MRSLSKRQITNPALLSRKNLKSVIPANQFKPHIPCFEPNQELQIDFGGPFFDEKGNEVYFLAAIDRFSIYPTACIYEKGNGPNVLKNLDMYIENHGVPRSIRLDQAKCLIGNQVKLSEIGAIFKLLKLQLMIIVLLVRWKD